MFGLGRATVEERSNTANSTRSADWIVCQIGAREHYAIPRALHRSGALLHLITDFWVPPGSLISGIPGGRRFLDRWHTDLSDAPVHAPNLHMLAFEAIERMKKSCPWNRIIRRNTAFQQHAIACLKHSTNEARCPTLFSYSYAALDLFRFAKAKGWHTVLGQIDPGPEEERIVAEEHQRYAHLQSSWQPAPKSYWDSWGEETHLADRIIVNSEWSRECLLKAGVPGEKMEIIPLVYEEKATSGGRKPENPSLQAANCTLTTDDLPFAPNSPLRLLFLGQINLRKGVGRLLDAMRMLKDKPVQLTLVGPSELDPSAWADLPNVRWLGPVARSEAELHYRDADAFILPTLSDGFALTQLEAASNGLPVIASMHCGRVVENGVDGMLLDSLEPPRLAESILKYSNCPQTWRATVMRNGFGLVDLARMLDRAVIGIEAS